MAMKNYKVEQEDGYETYYQFDPEEDLGKAAIASINAAAKDDASPVKSITQADPAPFNAKGK